MATRKDLLKAQTFTHERLVAALVNRDPDVPQPGLRRLSTGMFVGLLAGVLILAGFGVVGLLSKGGVQSWRTDDGELILIDTQSGAVFTYRGPEGNRQLRPAANITSARLLAGPEGKIISLKTASMKGVPIGRMQGIADAPRQLPDPKDMATLPIRVCSGAPVNGKRATTLEMAQGAVPNHSASVVLLDDQGNEYFVLEGRAHKVVRDAGVVRSPITEGFAPITAGSRFINALPQGVEFRPLRIDGFGGQPNRPVDNRLVGEVVVANQGTSSETYYVVLRDGYSRISYLDARLLQPDQARIQTVTSPQLAAARSSVDRASDQDMPDGKPFPETGANFDTSSVCATWNGANRPLLALGVPTPDAVPGSGGANAADKIVLNQGQGAMIQNDTALNASAVAYLVLNGKSYPVPDVASRQSLGYGDVKIVPVPGEVIRLIPAGLPAGVVLDQANASKEL